MDDRSRRQVRNALVFTAAACGTPVLVVYLCMGASSTSAEEVVHLTGLAPLPSDGKTICAFRTGNGFTELAEAAFEVPPDALASWLDAGGLDTCQHDVPKEWRLDYSPGHCLPAEARGTLGVWCGRPLRDKAGDDVVVSVWADPSSGKAWVFTQDD